MTDVSPTTRLPQITQPAPALAWGDDDQSETMAALAVPDTQPWSLVLGYCAVLVSCLLVVGFTIATVIWLMLHSSGTAELVTSDQINHSSQ